MLEPEAYKVDLTILISPKHNLRGSTYAPYLLARFTFWAHTVRVTSLGAEIMGRQPLKSPLLPGHQRPGSLGSSPFEVAGVSEVAGVAGVVS